MRQANPGICPDKPLLEIRFMPSLSAHNDRPPRSSLGRELGWVLLLKVILLAGLWFLFFRHDPRAARPSVDAAFFVKAGHAAPPSFPIPKETPHGIR